MSVALARLKKRAAELEQKKLFDKALEVYIQILEEGGKDLGDDDVPLFNRVGDMLIRKGNVQDALGYYERAVDVYAERGFLNNAIALCSKILRQSPGRTAVYYKLGRISARKGFKSDARKNFLEYADRMQKSGKADEAFRALKEFASLYPDQDDVRLILAELLSKENRKGEAIEQLQALYDKLESEGRKAEARATVDRMKAIDPTVEPRTTGSHPVQQAAELVFLDLTDDAPRSGTASPSAVTPMPTPSVVAPIRALDGLKLTFVPDEEVADATPPDGFEATASDDDAVDEPIEVLDDLEPTASDPGEPVDALELESVLDAEEFVPVERLMDLEPTSVEEVDELVDDTQAGSLTDLAPFDLDTGIADAGHLPEEPEAAIEREAGPLTESEFADLPLADVPRATPVRAHDLVLPGELPETPENVRTMGETPTSVAAGDDARAAAEEEADLLADIAAREAIQRHGTWPPHPAYGTAGHGAATGSARVEPADESTVLPDEEVDEPSSAPADGAIASDNGTEAAAVDDVDFLAVPPSFGAPESSGEFAFPPLAGLHTDGGIPLDSGDWSEAPGEALVEDEPVGESLVDEAKAQERRVEEDGEDAVTAARAHSPRSTLSIGGAEGHLRQRLELEPENWQLRRMLGEAMLDTGNREGGLYQLELAMVGFELDGDIDRAAEVVDEILGISSSSIRHHQKRVEYAVRARDRRRLIDAYLELADSLFRIGTADKAVSVYSRVLELESTNDRAEFALSTLAPEELARVRGAPLRPERWSDELDAIPDPAVSTGTEAADGTAPAAEVAIADLDPPAAPDEALVPASDAGSVHEDTGDLAAVAEPDVPAVDHEGVRAGEPAGAPPDDDPAADVGVPVSHFAESSADTGDAPPQDSHATAEPTESLPDDVDTMSDLAAEPGPDAGTHAARPVSPVEDSEPETRSTDGWEPEQAGQGSRLKRARSLTPAMTSDSDFVDLGEWLRATEPVRSTRMQVKDPQPTGDEKADFEELLRRFKRGVAENVEAEDYEAHYDLGVAYKEMGLIDEAIAQFQKALRGEQHRVRAYEALGQCFVEKKQYPIAAALLKRAIELPGTDDNQLVGVLYLLGFATEHMGRPDEALPYYLRVFAVDIEFRDVAERVEAMGNPTT